MTREDALSLYMSIRYNLPNHKMKEAVDIAFEALRECIEREMEGDSNG